jgi:hypothetical protein
MLESLKRSSSALIVPSRLHLAVNEALGRAIAFGGEDYERRRHLPRLIPLDPSALNDLSAPSRRAILARLARALRAERNRGRAGHWTYDLNRYVALKQAYEAEKRDLRSKIHEAA